MLKPGTHLCSSRSHLYDAVTQLPSITLDSYVDNLKTEIPLFHCIRCSQILQQALVENLCLVFI